MKAAGILAAALLPFAAACATTPAMTDDDPLPARPPEGECDAANAQDLLGREANAELGELLLQRTGATTLRWVPPRTAVTMDFRADRLTVTYDDDMRVTRISCG